MPNLTFKQLFEDLKAKSKPDRLGFNHLEHNFTSKVRNGGGKEVNRMAKDENQSKVLKAGKKTYFFDIKKTKEGKPFLVINESWYQKDGDEEPVRNSIMVFPNHAKDFAFALIEMLAKTIEV